MNLKNVKKINWLNAISWLLVIFGLCLLLYGYYFVTKMDAQNINLVKTSIEYGYFEGQKDAMNGDIKLKINKDSSFVWTESIWINSDMSFDNNMNYLFSGLPKHIKDSIKTTYFDNVVGDYKLDVDTTKIRLVY